MFRLAACPDLTKFSYLVISIFWLQEGPIADFLDFVDGHICGKPPILAKVFNLESAETAQSHFSGFLHINASMVKQVPWPSFIWLQAETPNPTHVHMDPIVVDISETKQVSNKVVYSN